MKISKEFIRTTITFLILLLALKYSGLLSSISSVTQSAVLHAGLLDAEVERINARDFSYDFTIKDLNGNKIAFDRYKGKVVFINLWATWCGPCRAEMASIQKLFNDVAADSISFVMLSIDRDEDQAKVVNYINGKQFTFPVFLPSGRLPEQLRVPSIPTTFVVSKTGKVVAKEVGTTNFNTDKFKRFLRELKAEE